VDALDSDLCVVAVDSAVSNELKKERMIMNRQIDKLQINKQIKNIKNKI
jgi:hypothetical protein